jgi:hypothetical protein
VKFHNEQYFTLLGKKYGLVNNGGIRVYTPKSHIKIKIDYEGNMVYQNSFVRLYATKNFEGKKVTFLSARQLRSLFVDMQKQFIHPTKHEMEKYIKIIDKKISMMKRLSNVDIITT